MQIKHRNVSFYEKFFLLKKIVFHEINFSTRRINVLFYEINAFFKERYCFYETFFWYYERYSFSYVYCYNVKKEIKQKFLQNLTNSVNFLQIETEQHTICPSLFENIQMYF